LAAVVPPFAIALAKTRGCCFCPVGLRKILLLVGASTTEKLRGLIPKNEEESIYFHLSVGVSPTLKIKRPLSRKKPKIEL